MFERSKLSVAVKTAISASALGMASTTLPALAQDEGATVVEEVVVTGSRIKRAVGDEGDAGLGPSAPGIWRCPATAAWRTC